VEYQVVERLREDGHEVLYVAEMEPGISDVVVLDRANREEAPLLTTDRDFGELVFRQGRLHPGVVLIRLSGLSTQGKADIVSAAISEHASEYLAGSFAVVTPSTVRFRRNHH
jgi:predicted nuclease of predicted toxin-antitoxin system